MMKQRKYIIDYWGNPNFKSRTVWAWDVNDAMSKTGLYKDYDISYVHNSSDSVRIEITDKEGETGLWAEFNH